MGASIIAAHTRALNGIRATKRGEQPIRPVDPFLLRDVSAVLIDCGLRPEECYRMRWDQIRKNSVYIQFGKTVNARREIPLFDRVTAILDDRRSTLQSGWVFAAPTKSNHIEQSTFKKLHAQASKISSVCPVHFSAYLPNPVVNYPGRVHSYISFRPQRFCNH